MPKRTNLANFAMQFEEVTRRALSRVASATPNGPPLFTTKRLASDGACANLQMQFRQFWSAILLAAREGTLAQEHPHLMDLAQRVNELAVRFKKGDKRTLEIIHRSQMVGAINLAEALGEEAQPIADAQARRTTRQLTATGQLLAHADPSVVEAIQRQTSGKAQDSTLEELYQVPAEGGQ